MGTSPSWRRRRRRAWTLWRALRASCSRCTWLSPPMPNVLATCQPTVPKLGHPQFFDASTFFTPVHSARRRCRRRCSAKCTRRPRTKLCLSSTRTSSRRQTVHSVFVKLQLSVCTNEFAHSLCVCAGFLFGFPTRCATCVPPDVLMKHMEIHGYGCLIESLNHICMTKADTSWTLRPHALRLQVWLACGAVQGGARLLCSHGMRMT